MSPARQRTAGITRAYKVISTSELGNKVSVRLQGGNNKEDYWADSYGVLTMIVPYDKAGDYIPGTICEVTLVNRKKAEADDRDLAAVLRPIGTASPGPR